MSGVRLQWVDTPRVSVVPKGVCMAVTVFGSCGAGGRPVASVCGYGISSRGAGGRPLASVCGYGINSCGAASACVSPMH